ncbi:hypothetical protein SCHPADRAFT_948275 [Schizopora paradoxa]|uniref:PNPLA domain-containing protein n=1 Tax=Schizopora paradoxa TaxID=27342 RepID=A0A0H2QWX9_9AGAM|nr:hypothetical protein SCHPADRAFT_948275 [Schizopora paradoxa]
MSTQSPNSEAPYVVVTHDPNVVPKHIVAACFDGGGVHAIAAAVVLKAIMDRLEAELYVPQADRLHEHFDMLAGTGTGGLLAVLLGRLRVSLDVEEITDIYKNIFQDASVSRRGTRMGQNVQNIVRKYEPVNNADAPLLDMRGDAIAVYVLAPQIDDAAGTPKIMRSINPDSSGTIVDAALAICAAQTELSASSRFKNFSSSKKRGKENLRTRSTIWIAA